MIKAAVFFVSVFFTYLFSLYSAFPINDSPAIIASCFTLSPAHPPGYPLYAILGKAASLMFPAAFAVNAMSAVFFALTGAVIFLFIDKKTGTLAALVSASLFCVSYMPWLQAIEAKGGIYGLNVLLSVLAVFLISSREKKQVLLAFFISGLALSNHSMSAVFLLPLLAAEVIRNKGKGALQESLLLITGLTPYAMLIIRAGDNPGLIWGEASNIRGFLEYILRLNYRPHAQMSASILASNLTRAVLVAGPAFAFAAAGFRHAMKNDRVLAINLLAFAGMVGAAAAFFNPTPVNMSFYAGIFMIPACAGFFALSGIGLFARKSAAVKAAGFLYAAASLLFCLYSYSGSRNYTGYDNALNIRKTMSEAGVLFSNDDASAMAAYYLINVKKEPIRHYAANDLTYKFGLKAFNDAEGGAIDMDSQETVRAAFETALKRTAVFVAPAGSGRLNRYGNSLLPYGILYSLRYGGTYVFKLYSYRSVINNLTDDTAWYPVMMLNTAALTAPGRQKTWLLEMALLFPHNMNREDIKRAAGRTNK